MSCTARWSVDPDTLTFGDVICLDSGNGCEGAYMVYGTLTERQTVCFLHQYGDKGIELDLPAGTILAGALEEGHEEARGRTVHISAGQVTDEFHRWEAPT